MHKGVLLGPQRTAPIVGEEAERLGIAGKVAVVTAGWQEREAEDGELRKALGRETTNLRLHARCDAVFREDPDLFAAHRQRQDRIKHLQEIYRVRLSYAMSAARKLSAMRTPPDLLSRAQRSALEAVRTLDDEHVLEIRGIHQELEARMRLGERRSLIRHRREVADIIADSSALAIAGGHVAALLNRLRLLDVGGALGGVPVIAWSAGAMAVSDRVVLFHDSPPQGFGNAEVLDAGLGLFPGVVPLPSARKRLLLDDRERIALFASRFEPAMSVTLDERCRLASDGERYTAGPGTTRLSPEGDIIPLDDATDDQCL